MSQEFSATRGPRIKRGSVATTCELCGDSYFCLSLSGEGKDSNDATPWKLRTSWRAPPGEFGDRCGELQEEGR
jgi:hypothetical protein